MLTAAAAAHWSPQPPAHRVRAALDLQRTLHALVLGGAAFSGGVYPSLTADALWATLLPTLTDPYACVCLRFRFHIFSSTHCHDDQLSFYISSTNSMFSMYFGYLIDSRLAFVRVHSPHTRRFVIAHAASPLPAHAARSALAPALARCVGAAIALHARADAAANALHVLLTALEQCAAVYPEKSAAASAAASATAGAGASLGVGAPDTIMQPCCADAQIVLLAAIQQVLFSLDIPSFNVDLVSSDSPTLFVSRSRAHRHST